MVLIQARPLVASLMVDALAQGFRQEILLRGAMPDERPRPRITRQPLHLELLPAHLCEHPLQRLQQFDFMPLQGLRTAMGLRADDGKGNMDQRSR